MPRKMLSGMFKKKRLDLKNLKKRYELLEKKF